MAERSSGSPRFAMAATAEARTSHSLSEAGVGEPHDAEHDRARPSPAEPT
jgi:hypothetical protein